MYEGSLVSIAGQPVLWCIGSFINWLKSERLNPAIKGSRGATSMIPETAPLDVTTGVEPKSTLGWVPAPAVGPYTVTICGEGNSKPDEESDEPGEDSVWGLEGL